MKKILFFFVFMLVCLGMIFFTNNKVNASTTFSEEKTILNSLDSKAVYYEQIKREVLTEAPHTVSEVFTPNGTPVTVKTYLEDMPDYYKEYLVEEVYPLYYSYATLIGYPTTRYNCHSYAWYSQDIENNNYWMPYPTEYYIDSSYDVVDYPREGDIICYYDDNGTEDKNDDENLHSGIIVSLNSNLADDDWQNASLVNVESKWGSEGLFYHRGDQCPYVEPSMGADYVVYYRPRTNNTYTLANYSSTINNSLIVNSNTQKIDSYEMYELDVEYTKFYEFSINSNNDNSLDVRLYDEHMQLMEILELDNDTNKVHFIKQLYDDKIYYLRVAYANEENTGTINTKIVSRTTAYIGLGDNDVLLNTHNYNEGIYSNNYYYYINNRGVGFYRFTLTGVKVDGTEVTYPYSSIMIKDHMNEDIIDKYSLTGYSNQAISGYNENTFVAYLNATGYFYVYIDFDTEGLKSLTLNIEPVESETIDLFTKSESTNSTMEILDSETTKGDYAKKIILKQAGEFTVNYSYSGSQSNDILFVLGKLNYNSTTQKYTIETLISQLMDAENDSFTYTLDLTDGTYFVAYFNKDDNAAFDVTFNRLVTQYGGSVLITDPDSMTDGGSQVEVYENGLPYYERSYRGTNIVIGFTRVIYIDYHYVDQHSREDYYWYSSNESIATVSQHGTVFGKSAGTVKIMAVNKDDPSIVFVKQFTVVQDTKTYSEVIYSEFNDTHKLSNGEYQLGLDVQNSPYPMAQYYSWRVVSKSSTITSVSIDQWGNVAIVGTGNIVIEGYNYIYNDNYGVRINLTVTN